MTIIYNIYIDNYNIYYFNLYICIYIYIYHIIFYPFQNKYINISNMCRMSDNIYAPQLKSL